LGGEVEVVDDELDACMSLERLDPDDPEGSATVTDALGRGVQLKTENSLLKSANSKPGDVGLL